MKLLSHLEKNKLFWWLVAFCLLFFALRLPSLIEPYWYGDEGIYETIGLAMSKGHLLYKDIWDNKPPLLYVIYAIAHGDQMQVRLFSLIVGIFSVISFYLLSLKLFTKASTTLLTTFVYVILFGSPLFEGNIGNAENFFLFPVITAAWLFARQIFRPNVKVRDISLWVLFTTGLILGIAFLLKVVVVFDVTAFCLFLFLIDLEKLHGKHIKEAITPLAPILAGFLIPFTVTLCYFAAIHNLEDYFSGAFAGNIDYVGYQNYLFGIPQGLLVIKLAILLAAVLWVTKNRLRFSHTTLFITLWTVFALFSANFSGRPYTHYLLVLLPSFCLLVGLIKEPPFKKRAKIAAAGVIAIAIFVACFFPTFKLDKSVEYYAKTISFLSGNLSLYDYQSFFDSKTPRDYALATFLKQNTKPNDKIFIWGDSAQIYALSDKVPPYKYTVAYHVKQSSDLLKETQQMIDTEKPRYIVVLPETQPLPFTVSLYIMRFDVEGATIYERSF